MAQIKDGWHVVYGESVYVENGKVTHGVKKRREQFRSN